jgi:hypothetical protein
MKGYKFDAISALAGMGAGLGLGTLVATLLVRRAYERRLASEIDSVKKYYRARAEAARARRDKDDRPPSVGEAGLGERPGSGRRVLPVSDAEFYPGDEGPVPASVTHHGDPMEGYPEDDDDDEDEDPGITPDDEPERIDTGPYVIAREEYFDPDTRGSDYRKIAITWYAKDKVLADDGNVPILDIARTVGPDFASRFGDSSDDPEIVYIRNNEREVDFEVTRDERAFVEVVLNYGRPR